MATIREIADRLGISISTVSKGLNGASDVSSNSTASYHDPSGKGRAWKMWLYGIAFPDESCVYQ